MVLIILLNTEDETLYRSILFIKNSMFNFINVYPNIIMNKVNYSEIKIPSHWNLSEYHEFDIKNIITNFYKGFKKFYNDKTNQSLF